MRYAKEAIILKTRSGQGQSVSKMVHDTTPSQDAPSHQICDSYLKNVRDMLWTRLFKKTRSDVKVKFTVTQKWYETLCHPKMLPHTIFGIPTSKNIRNCTGYGTDALTDRQCDYYMPTKVPFGA